jgi:hypothetical protein
MMLEDHTGQITEHISGHLLRCYRSELLFGSQGLHRFYCTYRFIFTYLFIFTSLQYSQPV